MADWAYGNYLFHEPHGGQGVVVRFNDGTVITGSQEDAYQQVWVIERSISVLPGFFSCEVIEYLRSDGSRRTVSLNSNGACIMYVGDKCSIYEMRRLGPGEEFAFTPLDDAAGRRKAVVNADCSVTFVDL